MAEKCKKITYLWQSLWDRRLYSLLLLKLKLYCLWSNFSKYSFNSDKLVRILKQPQLCQIRWIKVIIENLFHVEIEMFVFISNIDSSTHCWLWLNFQNIYFTEGLYSQELYTFIKQTFPTYLPRISILDSLRKLNSRRIKMYFVLRCHFANVNHLFQSKPEV